MPIMLTRRLLGSGEFEKWEARFKTRGTERKAAGCRGVRYFRGTENRDEVYMIFDWATTESGLAFVNTMLTQFPHLAPGPDGKNPQFEFVFLEEMTPLEN